MTDIFRFEKDGVLYAKGFCNQEGLTFYVLRGHLKQFYLAVENHLRMDANFHVEELTELPGEGGKSVDFPCGHPHNPGDDICGGLDCNDDLMF